MIAPTATTSLLVRGGRRTGVAIASASDSRRCSPRRLPERWGIRNHENSTRESLGRPGQWAIFSARVQSRNSKSRVDIARRRSRDSTPVQITGRPFPSTFSSVGTVKSRVIVREVDRSCPWRISTVFGRGLAAEIGAGLAGRQAEVVSTVLVRRGTEGRRVAPRPDRSMEANGDPRDGRAGSASATPPSTSATRIARSRPRSSGRSL